MAAPFDGRRGGRPLGAGRRSRRGGAAAGEGAGVRLATLEYVVDEVTRRALQRLLHVPHGTRLGVGRDNADPGKNYDYLRVKCAWRVRNPTKWGKCHNPTNQGSGGRRRVGAHCGSRRRLGGVRGSTRGKGMAPLPLPLRGCKRGGRSGGKRRWCGSSAVRRASHGGCRRGSTASQPSSGRADRPR